MQLFSPSALKRADYQMALKLRSCLLITQFPFLDVLHSCFFSPPPSFHVIWGRGPPKMGPWNRSFKKNPFLSSFVRCVVSVIAGWQWERLGKGWSESEKEGMEDIIYVDKRHSLPAFDLPWSVAAGMNAGVTQRNNGEAEKQIRTESSEGLWCCRWEPNWDRAKKHWIMWSGVLHCG